MDDWTYSMNETDYCDYTAFSYTATCAENHSENIYDRTCDFFPSFGKADRDFLVGLLTTWPPIMDITSNIGAYISFVGVATNLFHFWVLVQRPMRTSSTYLFLLGIAICDILSMVVNIRQFLVENRDSQKTELQLKCTPPETLEEFYSHAWLENVKFVGRWSAPWSGVLMAFLKILAVTKLIAAFEKIPPTLTAIGCMLLAVLASLSFSVVDLLGLNYQPSKEVIWAAPKECIAMVNFTRPYLTPTGLDYYDFMPTLQGIIFNIIPTVFFIVLTVLLIIVLVKNRPSKPSENSSTTPLVLYITLLFLPSAIPNAIANIALLIYSDNDGLKTLITASDPIWYCISIITATVHFAVCLTVSTQYRATARNLLRIPGIIRSNRIFKAFGSQSGQDVMFKR